MDSVFESVDELYSRFEATCRTYLTPPACERLHYAFEFAREAHENQQRKSGEPYIIHPLTVAHMMAKVYMDEVTLIGALLHDVAEDTRYSLQDIQQGFGSQTCHLVDGVTHLRDVSQLEDIAHLFMAMASDVRVVLIKLFDRLHNMQTLEFMSPESQRRKAFETLRVYVPLAAKFGIWKLKTELETLVLRYIDPDAYATICESIEQNQREHAPRLQSLQEKLQEMLRQYSIPCNIYVEHRNPYRIYESIRQQRFDGNNFKRMQRLVIQIDDVPHSYLALGYIHKHYAHMANLLADYIGNPRDIFYRSIHTTILVPRYSPVDLRIRTYEFERLAQIGVIAQLQFAHPEEQKQPKQATFLPELQHLYGEVGDPQKFVETAFQDILQKHITCFTPRGKEISLPRGATVLDFAYLVHTDIGHECRGGVVNGKPYELSHKLQDGDHIEIIRSRRAEPQLEWLDETLRYATTSHAQRKIREWLKKQNAAVLIKQGREVLHRQRRSFNVMHVTAQTLAREFQMDSSQMLYLQIGNGSITSSEMVRKLLRHVPDLFIESDRQYIDVKDDLGQVGRLVGMDGREVKLAYCCRPKIGERIVGYINGKSLKDVPIKIHRASCPYYLRTTHPEHFIQYEWIKSASALYVIYLRLEGYDRGGLLRDMTIPIAEVGANIAQVDSFDTEKNVVMRLKIELSNEDQLIRIVHRLETLQNITLVQRMTHEEAQRWSGKEV